MSCLTVRCTMVPQHAVPVRKKGRKCVCLKGTDCFWEAMFQIHADIPDATRNAQYASKKTPWVKQTLRRFNLGWDTDGRTCQMEEWKLVEYWQVKKSGWTALDYHFSGYGWNYKCPKICDWLSVTSVTGELVWMDFKGGKPYEPNGGQSDEPGNPAGDYANEAGSTEWSERQSNGTMGPWTKTQNDPPATPGIPNSSADGSCGEYRYAYPAQVPHCKDKNGNMTGQGLPPGSPATVVDHDQAELLRQILLIPKSWKLPEIPFDDDNDGKNPRPMDRGPPEFAMIGPSDPGGIARVRALGLPARAAVAMRRPMPAHVLFASIAQRQRTERVFRPIAPAALEDLRIAEEPGRS